MKNDVYIDHLNWELYEDIEEDSLEDRCYGCIVGAFLADATGSYNEFNTAAVEDDIMEMCMKVIGGGPG